MSTLKYFPPEICSLICQDPILKCRDLNSICFISHAFRAEAQRLLSYRFPCLRGITHVRSWCLSLKYKPHLAHDIQGLVLFLPPATASNHQASVHLAQTLQMCVNLKALFIFCQRRTDTIEFGYHWASSYMLKNLPFQLTKFVTDYFTCQDRGLENFLRYQPMLETVEMHPRCSLEVRTAIDLSYLPHLRTLSCSPLLFYFSLYAFQLDRLQLDFENSRIEWKRALLWISSHNIWQILHHKLLSLVIFLERKKVDEGRNQCHFLEIMDFVGTHLPFLKHLQIHQFLPTVRS